MIVMLALLALLHGSSIGKSAKTTAQENACLDNGNAMTNALTNQKLVTTNANQVKIENIKKFITL